MGKELLKFLALVIAMSCLTACGKKPVETVPETVAETVPETQPLAPLEREKAEVYEDVPLIEADDADRGTDLRMWIASKEDFLPVFILKNNFAILNKSTAPEAKSREEFRYTFGYNNVKDSKFYEEYIYPVSMKTFIMSYLNKAVAKGVNIEPLASTHIALADINAKSFASMDKGIGDALCVPNFTLVGDEGGMNLESESINSEMLTVAGMNLELYGFNYARVDGKYDGFTTYLEPSYFKEVTENVDLTMLNYPDDELILYVYSDRPGVDGSHVDEYIKSLTEEMLEEDLDFSQVSNPDYNGAKFTSPEFISYIKDNSYEKKLQSIGLNAPYKNTSEDFSPLIVDADVASNLFIAKSMLFAKVVVSFGDYAQLINTLPVDNIHPTKNIIADKNSVYILTDINNEILCIGRINPDYVIPVPESAEG